MKEQVSVWVIFGALLTLVGCAAPPESAKVNSTGKANNQPTQSTQPAFGTPAETNAVDSTGNLDRDPAPLRENPELTRLKAEKEKDIHLSLVNKMISQKNEYAALAHLDSFDRKWGATLESKRLRADCLRRTKQLDQAETLYKTILGQQNNARVWYGLGKVSIEKNDTKTAAMRLEKATQVDPLMVEAYSDLGLIYLLDGKQSAAYDTLMKATQLASNDPGVLANLALWGLVYQDFELAQTIADKLKWSDKTRTQVLNQANAIRKRIGNPGDNP